MVPFSVTNDDPDFGSYKTAKDSGYMGLKHFWNGGGGN